MIRAFSNKTRKHFKLTSVLEHQIYQLVLGIPTTQLASSPNFPNRESLNPCDDRTWGPFACLAPIEFGAGIPLLIVFKRLCFGPTSKVHFLTYGLVMLKGVQGHSGNPYASYFFVPVLDYLIRPPLAHNLHHVIQSDYYSSKQEVHVCNPEARRKDIDLYNKHLKTQFPRSV